MVVGHAGMGMVMMPLRHQILHSEEGLVRAACELGRERIEPLAQTSSAAKGQLDARIHPNAVWAAGLKARRHSLSVAE